ncbi:MAG: hypothetical protein AB7S63_08340 [Thauera sp.]
MTARSTEAEMLRRCTDAAIGKRLSADDVTDANVFRLAAMLLRSTFPDEAARLNRLSEAYFRMRPDERLAAEEVIRRGWLFSLPRTRQILTSELQGR